MKKFLKKQRIKLKHFYHQKKLKYHNFSIISNNCWGTRVYQRFGLAYLSPFQSLFIFAPDYINLIQTFSSEKLIISHFISKIESKYKEEIFQDEELKVATYPIGVLVDGTELHFLHYKTVEDAKIKWDKRVKRINFDKIIFKFSDGYLATDSLVQQFDNLPFKHKICFTAKAYPNLQSGVYMDMFSKKVDLEWKYDKKYINLHKFINQT